MKYTQPRRRTEDQLQRACISYLAYQFRGAMFHHSPNEGKRNPITGKRNKDLGTSPGFPDLLIFYQGTKLAVEFKTKKNQATPTQKQWLETLQQHGFFCYLCYSLDDFVKILNTHLIPLTSYEANHRNRNNTLPNTTPTKN